MAKKYVYLFSEGNKDMRELLGGKGANLAEMTNLGLPIPQGFTVTTEACTDYYKNNQSISAEIEEQIFNALSELEKIQGKKFGDNSDPLLVSVRSGARASMPGMMDTILNLGLNDEAVEGFAAKTGNPRFAYDSYRRFIQMYSDVVMGLAKSRFEEIIDEIVDSTSKAVKIAMEAQEIVHEQEIAVSSTTSSFENIDNQIKKLSHALEDILASVQEIDSARVQTLAAIENISAVSEENASASTTVNEAAAKQLDMVVQLEETAKVLSEHAKELEESIKQFKVR